MSGEALLSIVTIVKNDRAGLLRTFHSLREQDSQHFEWVVIDGASSDGTAQLVAELATAATRWRSEPDAGIYDAMNRGVALATGSHLLFLNAGDRLSGPGVVTRIIGRLRDDLDLLFGHATMVFHDRYRLARPARSPARTLWRGLPALHQATVFSRRALVARPYDVSFAITGDYDAMAALLSAAARYEMLDVVIADFAVGGTSFGKPFKLLAESNRVRRDVLRQSIATRALATSTNLFFNIALWVLWHGTRLLRGTRRAAGAS